MSMLVLVPAAVVVLIVVGLWLDKHLEVKRREAERIQRQKAEQEQLARALAAAAKPAFYSDLQRQAQEREAHRIRQQTEAAERQARLEIERRQEIEAHARKRALEDEQAARLEAASRRRSLEQALVADFNRYRFKNDLVPKPHNTPAERVAFLVHLTETKSREGFDKSRELVAFIENEPQRVWELLDQATAERPAG